MTYPMKRRHAPRHQRRPIWHAHGARDVKAIEDDAVRGDAVDVGRSQHVRPIAPKMIRALLVGDDEEKVRTLRHEVTILIYRKLK